MTGSFVAEGSGVQTLRYRQSSSVLAAVCRVALATCAQRLPNFDASSVVVHGVGFCGEAQRSGPTGGCAYGMPRNADTVPSAWPWIGPSLIVTRGAPPSPAAASGVVPTSPGAASLGVPGWAPFELL